MTLLQSPVNHWVNHWASHWPNASSAPAPSRRWPRPTAWTATSSRSTPCGLPPRSAPGSSTSPARPTAENPVATLTLQPTSTWRGHRAGQYVQVGVEINGARRTTRCFSISSAESNPGERFTITVRAHDEAKPGQQRVSKFLVREAQPGQVLHLSQAQGEFTLSESPATPTNNHLLMISGGSGITPVMSQLRTLLRDGYDGKANRKVTFLHYARSPEDQIFAEELHPHPVGGQRDRRAPALRRRRSSLPSRWRSSSRTSATPTPGPADPRR